MRGGFLGGILNSGAFITAGQNITNAVGELKAGDVIFNNVMAEKLRQRSNIINGEEMAKYVSRTGYVSMMNAMDRIQQIHEHITESASDKIGLSKENIDEQRKQFKRIAAIANSREAKTRAKQLGIKEGSDTYRSMVALMNVADQIQMENIDLFNDLVEQAQAVHEEDGMSLNVIKLFEQAYNAAVTPEQKELIDAAKEFAEWVQPLNNEIVSRYNALNKLISELESRDEYLTVAERRNLNHYKAQRKKLDNEVERIKEQIGGTENMQFMNSVP
jgi:translation initiation factor 2B subunit (eIF-2B alpha/beta/delta family)